MTAPSEVFPSVEDFDINDQRIADDPYSVYERMRSVGPVVYTRPMGYVVTDFALCEEVLTDWETYTSTQGKGATPAAVQRRLTGGTQRHTYADFPVVPIEVDPPEHSKYRALLGSQMSMPVLRRKFGELTTQIAQELLAAMQGRAVADFATEFAIPLAGMVLAEVVGLPSEDRPMFQRWAADIDGNMAELDAYLREKITTATKGLFGHLNTAEIEGRPLTTEEKIGYGLILIHAGWESSGSAMASAVRHLATNHADRDRLAADPSLIPLAAEELLRVDTPAQALWRTTTREVVLGGISIPAGEKVLVLWGAANRDHAQFPDATCPHLDRMPNRHMVFGRGIHACLGQHLARLELVTAMQEVLRVYPKLTMTPGAEVHIHGGIVRAIRVLPIQLQET